MKINLQKIITPSIFLTAFTFVASIVLWILFYYINPVAHPMKGIMGFSAESIIPVQSLFAHLLTLGLMLLIAMAIAQINNKYAYINVRTFLHVFLFLFISLCLVTTHGNYLSYLSALFVVFSIYLFFDNYGKETGTEIPFLGFIFLGLSIAIVPEYIFLIPLFWIGFYQIRSLSFRTFFASIFGFLVPWVIIYIIDYFATNQLDFYPSFFYVFDDFSLVYFKNIESLIFAVFFSIVIIFMLASIASRTNRESIKTRKMLAFFQLIGFGVILLMVSFSSNLSAYIPLAVTLFAIIASYVFTFQRTLFYSILFILMCVVSILFTLFQLLF